MEVVWSDLALTQLDEVMDYVEEHFGLLTAQVRKSVDSPPDMLTKRLSSHGTCFPIKSSTFASWQRRLPN
ncbi:hypothetical protein V7T14_15485, partial [Segatella copri]|nr:hypothetical protein [Segatella copri]